MTCSGRLRKHLLQEPVPYKKLIPSHMSALQLQASRWKGNHQDHTHRAQRFACFHRFNPLFRDLAAAPKQQPPQVGLLQRSSKGVAKRLLKEPQVVTVRLFLNNAGTTIRLKGAMTWRSVTRIVDDDTLVYEMYGIDKKGNEEKIQKKNDQRGQAGRGLLWQTVVT